MKIDEIEKLANFDYEGEEHWGDVLYPSDLKRLGKPIKLANGFVAYANQYYVQILKPIKDDGDDAFLRVAGMKFNSSFLPTPKPAKQVSTASIHPQYRKKGLARVLYHLALRYVTPYLEAGSSQTPGGRKMWLALANDPRVQIQGIIKIYEEELIADKWADRHELRIIDSLLQKFMAMGPEYMGKSRREKSLLIFSVPIAILPRALALAQEFPGIKLYQNRYNEIGTSLLATLRR